MPLLIIRDIIYNARRYPIANQRSQNCDFSHPRFLSLRNYPDSIWPGALMPIGLCSPPKAPTDHHKPSSSTKEAEEGYLPAMPQEPALRKTSSGKGGIIRKTCCSCNMLLILLQWHSHLRAIQACTDLPSTEHLKLEPGCPSGSTLFFSLESFTLWVWHHLNTPLTSKLPSPY